MTLDPTPALPVACTLGLADGRQRMRRWEALAETARPVAERCGRSLEVRFEPVAGALEELTALAAAEQDCCAFVDWSVTQTGGQPVLRVLADVDRPNDVAGIAALFGTD